MTLLTGMIIPISFRFNCDYEEKKLHYWVLVRNSSKQRRYFQTERVLVHIHGFGFDNRGLA